MIKTEGIEFFFKLANGLVSLPENYYIGWCEEAEDEIAKAASLGDLTELAGSGYARQAVAGDDAEMIAAPAGDNGWTLTTKKVTFTAAGGDWALAKTRFLATSSDDSGYLIATEPLKSGAGVALLDTKSYDCEMQIASEPPA